MDLEIQHTHTHTHTYTQMVSFYGSQFIDDRLPVEGTKVTVEGLDKPAVVNKRGMYLFGTDGKKVCVMEFEITVALISSLK